MSLIGDIVDPVTPGLFSLERSKAPIERSLRIYLPEEDAEPKAVHRAMRYAVLRGGHRWRPLLTVFAAEACGGCEGDVLPAACAFELLHCSSLILDDLPCMDDAKLRRDKPACHKVFGEAVSIMASIALLSLAHRLVLDNCRNVGLPTAATHRLLQDVLALTASEGMIAGQCADLSSGGFPPDRTSLAAVHHSKTGLLLVAACTAGALLVGATDPEVECLQRYAAHLGLAYQIQDDLHDAAEDAGGLPARDNSDLGKATFASFYGASSAAHRLRRHAQAALDSLQPLGSRAAKLRHLADQMISRAAT